MENKSQVSLEYLIMIGVVTIVATLAISLTVRVTSMEKNILITLKGLRDRIIQIK